MYNVYIRNFKLSEWDKFVWLHKPFIILKHITITKFTRQLHILGKWYSATFKISWSLSWLDRRCCPVTKTTTKLARGEEHGHATKIARGGHDHATKLARGGHGHATKLVRGGHGHATKFARGGHSHATKLARGGHGHATKLVIRIHPVSMFILLSNSLTRDKIKK